jgi:uncharacterized protein (DUF433 family)
MERGKVPDVGAHGADEDAPAPRDPRFRPLYTLRTAAFYLAVPEQTLRNWSYKYSLVKASRSVARREPTLPFIGLAEGFVVAAFRRRTKRHLRYVLEVLQAVEEDLGVENALASERLAIHGRDILIRRGTELAPSREFFEEVLSKNRVFDQVVEGDLKYITYAEDGWAERLVLPWTKTPVVEVSAERAYGHPVFIRSGARIIDAIDRFNAGDDPEAVAADFRVEKEEVLDIVRVFSKRAKEEAA